jgi:UDP-glucose 4-epimerase
MAEAPVLILGGHGYIGSRLAGWLAAAGLPVTTMDVAPAPGPVPGAVLCGHYQDLTTAQLGEYGSVVLLAGHSSVAACQNDPAAAFANNVSGFVALAHKLRRQKFLFASSVSVYVDTGGRLGREDDPLPEAVSYYDLHKQTVERYAALACANGYALRLGTLCGPSPNPRTELLLNSLVRSAVEEGLVRVANRGTHRPLLGVEDFCRAVEAILIRPVPSGRYNLASFNARIGDVADFVAARFGVPCVEVNSPTRYDIRADTAKFQATAGVRFSDTLAGLVDALEAHYAAGRVPADGGRG